MNTKKITIFNTLGLLGITIVLFMGSVLQVSLNELPCPLCLLQRLGFVMVMFGFMLNEGRDRTLTIENNGFILQGTFLDNHDLIMK
ncbi:hypothetical protein VSWAT3_15162 [Vibrionales bacterium SWAT-3]|nr:hypothetical protein VSWAT3_15162 [Vibrionales bacterium SWAT-3]